VNTRDRQLVFVLREPKNAFEQATEDWGARPLQKLAHGRYGLGLYRARSILGAHHGTLNARYDSAESTLVTTVELPLLDAGK
jgi:signal transduction histidine kinase